MTRIIFILILAGIGYWLYSSLFTAKPGQSIPNQGRDHVAETTKVDYNSNPPTSGPHSEQWEKAGVYDRVLSDLRLVHSLEHGYVIISYNCQGKQTLGPWPLARLASKQALSLNVYAHETEETHEEPVASDGAEPDVSDWKNNQNCQTIVAKLTEIASNLKVWKLIVVPRPNLDAAIALTAWTRIDKMNQFDEKIIVSFVKTWRDKGPEKTME